MRPPSAGKKKATESITMTDPKSDSKISALIPPDLSRFVREDIRRMKGYVPGEQPQGVPILKLNTNENPYGPSPRVLEAIRAAADPERLRKYPDPMGNSFREAAAKVYGVKPGNILCGNGSDDILTILTRTFVPQGGIIASPYPSYLLYETLSELQGATFRRFSYAGNGWELPQGWEGSRPNLAYIANPNSPSGTFFRPQAMADFAMMLRRTVVFDEAYADFAPENAIGLVRDQNSFPAPIIVSRTLSKSYSLAGIRFGFAIADEAVIHEMAKVKDSYNCDAVSIAAATAAISDQDYFHLVRDKILATREASVPRFQQLGFSVIASHANFLWVDHLTSDPTTLYQGLRAANILVRLMNYPGWRSGLRITIGTDAEMDRLFDALAALV